MSSGETEQPDRPSVWKRPLEYIAFWQFLGFIMIICLIWVNEVLRVGDAIFGAQPAWLRACALTAGVIIVGFITIAHSFHQERQVLRGIITICSYCKKVQLDEAAWQRVDEFVAGKTMAEFSHGICPDCYTKMVGADDTDQAAEELSDPTSERSRS
jgi:hypothetical protein